MSPIFSGERASLAWLWRRLPSVPGGAPRVSSPMEAEKAEPTVTIFDWDDTLLCTSHLQRQGDDPDAGAASARLRRLEDVACRMLRHAMRVGQVYIVTNASSGWVEVDRWKKLTFMKIAQDLGIGSFKNFIVIGDSDFEMRAADTIGSVFENVRIKAIKLKEDPTDEDLARELQLVLGNFDTFVADDRDITVVLERKRRSSPATRVSL